MIAPLPKIKVLLENIAATKVSPAPARRATKCPLGGNKGQQPLRLGLGL